MITPLEIIDKAQRLYPKAIAAWLNDEADFFPRLVPANTEPSKVHSEAMQQVHSLRSGSKEHQGFGYSIAWETRKSRTHGEQRFPTRIYFETLEDLLKLTGMQSEFRRLRRCVELLRHGLPLLEKWGDLHWKELIALDPCLSDLIQVTKYILEHPRPNCFPRELRLSVTTKVIEQNKALLAEWFDLLLPPSAIDCSFTRKQFSQRYGFKTRREHFLLRILDESLLEDLCCPGIELSLPIETLGMLPVYNTKILIVENQTNLLTFPMRKRTIAIGGFGYGITQFFHLPWLESNPIQYWGDLDTDGFLILAALRRRFPQAKSMMMDRRTLDDFISLVSTGNGQSPVVPDELIDEERQAFLACRENNWRLEQEHIPQRYVDAAMEI